VLGVGTSLSWCTSNPRCALGAGSGRYLSKDEASVELRSSVPAHTAVVHTSWGAADPAGNCRAPPACVSDRVPASDTEPKPWHPRDEGPGVQVVHLPAWNWR
jgi:hypothetical protein